MGEREIGREREREREFVYDEGVEAIFNVLGIFCLSIIPSVPSKVAVVFRLLDFV